MSSIAPAPLTARRTLPLRCSPQFFATTDELFWTKRLMAVSGSIQQGGGVVDGDHAVDGLKRFAELRDPHTGFSVSHFPLLHQSSLPLALRRGVSSTNADRSIGRPCSLQAFEDDWRKAMLKVNSRRSVVVAVFCEGRVCRMPAAFRLRDIVTQQKRARVILLDVSDVQLGDGGWACWYFCNDG